MPGLGELGADAFATTTTEGDTEMCGGDRIALAETSGEANMDGDTEETRGDGVEGYMPGDVDAAPEGDTNGAEKSGRLDESATGEGDGKAGAGTVPLRG